MSDLWLTCRLLGRLLRVRISLRRGFSPAWERWALAPVVVSAAARPTGRLVTLQQALMRCFRIGCLPRSLVLCSLLRELGEPAEVRIGVRREAGQLRAHAWVVLRGEVLGEVLEPGWQALPMEQAASHFAKAAAPTS